VVEILPMPMPPNGNRIKIILVVIREKRGLLRMLAQF